MNTNHDVYLSSAAKLAFKSDNNKHKHGCIIINNKGHIISQGINRNYKNNPFLTVHAEQDALLSIDKKKLKKYKCLFMYVVRIKNTDINKLKLSKPCDSCQRKILKFPNIKYIYYS
ncbi:hypothetical protein [Heterosigma akashiwo virus 01]|uniref:CMP/dCMP-type deaminase domain-containing protein n=1 Tax=Heterosigma akashiwo virus 01 TaxID=97195 RepID=A0A1C9C519_HAV01|nr:hypothetical protein D1R72_gp051 [Heterosigma akashiwo virus 01]AOM63382.1 hypothetical protein [Heterosigma akashiwo virus 01]